VRPGEYLGVTGPRSAWLGTETGRAELWVHPLKLATDVQLAFKVPQYREPVRGSDVARTIDVRPEMTTITYSHMAFTVRQHILAPRSEAGLLVLLDVETFVPLEVVVELKPVLQYMWPGAFGGQYMFWDAGRGAFVLSESLQRRNAVIGTSWPAQGEVHPAHRLADAPAAFVIPVDSTRAASELIPIAIAAGTQPRDTVFATWERLLANAEAFYHESRAWADTVLASTTTLDTPDDALDLALEWSKVNLEEQRVCNPDLGCGFVAGWGMSGASTRPGFGWYFGGDAAITSLAMDVTGQWEPVAEALRFLATYQRADGKMPHEVSQAAAHLDWFDGYPYPYYHADTTPYWMVALWEYWKASGDDATVRDLWGAYTAAWRWCLTAESDGDGIIENTLGGLGAIEVGGLGEGMHQDIYLAAVWIQALEATRQLASHLGDEMLAAEATALRVRALTSLNEAYWRPDDDQHAFGILRSGGTNDNLTAWPGTALSFHLLAPERAERTLRKLATDSISSDWGARLLSVGSDLYEPLHYNNGAVWPFMTGFVAWGQYRYRRPWAGAHLVDAVKQLTFDWSRGRYPENLSGAYYRPMDATVPHQFFATSMLAMPLLRGLVGWEPDAPRARATLAPQLPPDWDRVGVERLRVGEASIDVEISREPERSVTRLTITGPPVTLEYVQSVPAGARDIKIALDARSDLGQGDVRQDVGPHDVSARVTLPAGAPEATITVMWTGGLEVIPPRLDLEPGQESTGLRVVDFGLAMAAPLPPAGVAPAPSAGVSAETPAPPTTQARATLWDLTVEGLAGHPYELVVRGEAIDVLGGPARAGARDPTTGRTPLTVTLPGADARVAAVIRLGARRP
jgi:glycogen debranching enzyme